MALAITDNDMQKILATEDRPVVLDFWAPWCAPCQLQGPILEEFAEAVGGRALVGKVNVDESPVFATHFQIRSIPTIIVLNKGREVARAVGLQSKENLERLLRKAETE